MSARFEIVRTDGRGGDRSQPWHARFVAANGKIVWTTETYSRRKAALNAIRSFLDPFYGQWLDEHWFYRDGERPAGRGYGAAIVYRSSHWEKTNAVRLEIREVDERRVSS